MMDKDKLRKADIFSGAVIMLFGLWVVYQAAKMPMKDSYGGVQNVWYVSPALLPLFVGAMIALLGALLIRIALKSLGREGLREVFAWLGSSALFDYLKSPPILRFYAMIALFFSFVFLYIPRIDFFICALLFLMAFITMFYFDDERLLKKLLYFYMAVTGVLLAFFVSGLAAALNSRLAYSNDLLVLLFLASYSLYAWSLVRHRVSLRRKYRTALIIAVVAPFTIGPIFKYFLLVPMPTEGMVVALLDAIWYWDF